MNVYSPHRLNWLCTFFALLLLVLLSAPAAFEQRTHKSGAILRWNRKSFRAGNRKLLPDRRFNFRIADQSERTTVMTGIRRHHRARGRARRSVLRHRLAR